MFEKLLKELEGLKHTTFSVPVPVDEDGYLDKECPSPACMFQFKLHADDWHAIVRDEEVFCPFCRHAAPARSWFTTEQVEHIQQIGIAHLRGRIDNALKADADAWNRRQPSRAFLKITLSVKSAPTPLLLPLAAADPMRQKTTCVACGCRYSYIGAAFFCPSCGYNSAEETFKQSLTAIRTAAQMRATLLAATDRDTAQITIRLLREKGMNDTVMALQRHAERLYERLPGAPPAPRNVFQRLDDGSALWHAATGTPYSAILDAAELSRLKIYFQQRHLLAHAEGVVDRDYIAKSGDPTYRMGQRLVINEAAVLDFVALAEKLGDGLIASL